ncbi:hypothetical protein GUJ93_ZPchr0006g44408 [Zizania palustris]|uniref:Uncharacterized protein n=1 Tax=Zizania palustris TaxID=103762 RepID=A0A8J5SVR7_ZIZPA|nr:hypothetical protein GUJ93_ZPchr0006g44408 [Zizania palustris]
MARGVARRPPEAQLAAASRGSPRHGARRRAGRRRTAARGTARGGGPSARARRPPSSPRRCGAAAGHGAAHDDAKRSAWRPKARRGGWPAASPLS